MYRSISNAAARVLVMRRHGTVGIDHCCLRGYSSAARRGDGVAAATQHRPQQQQQQQQQRSTPHLITRSHTTSNMVARTGASLPAASIRAFGSSSSSSGGNGNDGVSDRGGAIVPVFGSATEFLHLPPADDPVGLQLYQKSVYCPSTGVLRTSMHVGTTDDNQGTGDGVVGDTVSVDEARIHATNSGLRLLSTVHAALGGDLGRVERVLHLRGMVRSTPEFRGHASVVDGCSEVLRDAFGPDAGVGTRECFGVGSLGATVACTIELKVRPPLE